VTRARSVLVALGAALLFAATGCSDDPDGAAPTTTGGATSAATGTVLEAIADEVIVPSYEALVASFEQLATDVDAVCAAPSEEALATARGSWQEVATAWRATRPVGVGPAMERRLAAAIGFQARAAALDELLAGDDPVDPAGLEGAGAAVKGIAALELGLFGEGADALAGPGDPRRCTYLASATGLAQAATAEVLADWTDGYRDTFVEGMDGDPQSSVDAIVNELIFRVTETDDQGLRALVEADSADDLPANRADGPAAFHAAELRATVGAAAALLGADPADGRLLALVAAGSEDTAGRLGDATAAATAAMADLPDSVTAAFDDPEALARAQESVAALKVLLATEVASELGVTLSFSDADGDS
jgi:predicted lipoprotein